MTETSRIDLAHEAPFRLGALNVRPALRQLVRDDGAEEVVEPRVMQVLVALARAQGGILSREDLSQRCWEGRVVGDDAINRVISRLRRSAEGIGQGAFRIETITKVGYRLLRAEPGECALPPARPAEVKLHRMHLDRRAMFAGAGLAIAGAGGFGAWRYLAHDPGKPPADIAPLLEQARLALRQGNTEGAAQAMGLLRRATELRPEYANGWGLLAMSYAGAARGMARENEAGYTTRAQEAIDRAFKLDAANAYARFAVAMLDRRTGAWLRDERLASDILARDPDNDTAREWLAGVYSNVGRCREAVEIIEGLYRRGKTDPGTAYTRAVALWSVGRLDEAERASYDAISLFPSHFAVWFTRFYFLMYTGRAADALALSRNNQQRPPGFTDENFAMIEQVAQAMLTRDTAQVKAAVAASLEWAHRGAGFAENGIQFAAALGDVGAAFQIADAYYFGRGFQTGENRFQLNQRIFTRQENRRTRFLFFPSTSAMRSDPRFEKLISEVGLSKYWQESGTLPDYKKA
ncbi:MAG: hypothetical protein EOP61_00160 [Sphingomonadales bacterium]|nr:MAG: hypothetical protein EOP61_00160 [Sphingomonadales bacterium]